MDVLIRNDKLTGKYNSVKEFLIKTVKEELKPIEFVPNGDVFSFNYKDIQVDFIFSPIDDYEFAKNYFSFNDLGNFQERISSKMGFKFGHDGVWYVMRDGDYVIKEILVSNNYLFMIDYFGFDIGRYLYGFDELEDIFDYVISSKYFTPEIFLLENRNHIARIRDRKRVSYQKLLLYIKDMPTGYVFESKEYYLNQMLNDSRFSDFKETYESVLALHKVHKAAKEKYNGLVVSEVTGLTHKELGAFMSSFKKHIAPEKDYEFWHKMYELSEDEIKASVSEYFKIYK